MAKSMRSKSKRSHRATKRTTGDYAIADSARLFRLNQKLKSLATSRTNQDPEEDVEDVDEAMPGTATLGQQHVESTEQPPDSMEVESPISLQPKAISTHGPRGSRREEWRRSKNLSAFPTSKGMNRQGGLSAKRRPGRSQRRR